MRFVRFNRVLAFGIALALIIATPVFEQASFAQATTASGAIQGTVTDPKGAVLPGVTVTITNMGTNSTKRVTTDSSGFYAVASLPPAQYRISTEVSGFSKMSTTVMVQIGNSSNGNLRLQVGNTSEVVEVNAGALAVNTVQSTVQGVLTEKQIETLPISGRNFLDLAQLEPGVQLQSGETFDPTKAGYSSIAINGFNGRTARILLDGQDISDETVGTSTLNVSQGSIEEFQISRSSLDISNEITSSGSVTVSTRSGTNDIHGQAFGLFRDQRAGAAASPGGHDFPFQRNQFGGRLGGPIVKNKLFFFGSGERIKQDSFNSVQVLAPFQALSGGFTAPFRDTYYAAKLDYNAPKSVHMFFRTAYENNLDDSAFGFGFSRFGNKDNTPSFAGGADFTMGKLTNSLRVSYLKFHNFIADETATGVPNFAPGVFLRMNNNLFSGPNELAPQVTFQSDKQFRYDAGLTIKAHVFNFGVSANRILGGGFASFFGLAPRVTANFQGGPVGGGLASDPAAYATSSVTLGNGQGFNTERPQFGFPAGGQEDWRLGIYFGDTWKVSRRLTLNFGVRYSRDTGRSDSDLAPTPCADADSAFGAASPCNPANYPGGVLPSNSGNLLDQLQPGLGAKVRQPDSNWGPKFGFAYDLKGDGKTVLRGGLGLYYENSIFNNVLFDRAARLPQGLFFGTASVSVGQPSITLPDGTVVSSVNGQSLATLLTEPISASAPFFAALQQQYQAATIAAGAAANSGYIANVLAEGPDATGLYLYSPKYKTARSVQMNIGVEHEMWKGGIFAADYIRNVGLHFMQQVDQNHVGDARFLNVAAAQNAIATTLTKFGCGTIDCAIGKGALIGDFAGNGLDSGIGFLSGTSASLNGLTPATGAAFPGQNPNFGEMFIVSPIGRSVFNAFQTSFRQTARIPLRGLRGSNFQISYALSRFISSAGGSGTTGPSDQNFTPLVWDSNNPLGFSGPAGTDRKHQISVGGSFTWAGGFTTSVIGHYYSALPTDLFLDDNGNPSGAIFSSDLTGDGTTKDLLPGFKSGALNRSVKPGDLGRVIANYNATSAGRLTPAGQALVSAGLFTSAQMTSIGAVTPTIAAPPSNNVGNGNLRTFDLALSRPIKFGDRISLEPSFAVFNLFNFSNFGSVLGNLASQQQPGTANGTDSSLESRGALRTGNGSGVFTLGAARIVEYGLKFNF